MDWRLQGWSGPASVEVDEPLSRSILSSAMCLGRMHLGRSIIGSIGRPRMSIVDLTRCQSQALFEGSVIGSAACTSQMYSREFILSLARNPLVLVALQKSIQSGESLQAVANYSLVARRSGVGFGNFGEIGPLDINLKTRNFTWLRKADLLFVPSWNWVQLCGGYQLYAKTEEEATADLVTLLTELSKNDASLQKSPLFIVAESYGGKFAVTLALSALKAIQQGKLKLILGGVALGNSWISPEDFCHLSRLDDNGLKKANSIAERIKQQLQDGQFVDATNSWGELQSEIIASSNSVDFHNFLQDSESDSVFLNAIALGLFKEVAMMRYSKYLTSMTSSLASENDDIERLLDGVIKNKLKIIPQNVTYTVHSTDVFENFMADFMKPRVSDVDELLALGVNVTVYNGQISIPFPHHLHC
ncbi:hypothetical protein Fmac_019567 [Flemingia macrophylla]|uniref:Carboxypeptidase n=1 Tax=Flemingia macrophylla TaxID=520843 RepID=A0ABD1M870_9FABA